jgi:DNA-binding transcriptional LysR family regulator
MAEWDHMRIALAIHRTGSMQGAADMLRIDRTTVLRRLDAMESQMGVRLFERRSDGCVLTKSGEEVVGTAESIEASMALLGHRVGGDASVAEGKVIVTVPEYFAAKILIPALPRLHRDYPGIEVKVHCGHQFLNLLRGEADIGLRNKWPEQNTLIARKVASVGYAFYASRSYLEARGTPEDSFAGHDFILLDESLSGMVGYDRMLELSSAGKTVMRSNEILPMVMAACAGLGIAFLPCMATHGHAELSGLWPGLIGGLRDVYLVMPEDLRHQARVRAVYDFMADLCHEFGPVMAGRDVSDAFPVSRPT